MKITGFTQQFAAVVHHRLNPLVAQLCRSLHSIFERFVFGTDELHVYADLDLHMASTETSPRTLCLIFGRSFAAYLVPVTSISIRWPLPDRPMPCGLHQAFPGACGKRRPHGFHRPRGSTDGRLQFGRCGGFAQTAVRYDWDSMADRS